MIGLFWSKKLDVKFIHDYLDKEPYISGVQDVLLILLCFFGVCYLITRFTNKYKIHDGKIYFVLWLYHLYFILKYYFKGKGGAGTLDSRMYYMKGINPNAYYRSEIEFSFGSDFMFWISTQFHNIFNFNYLSMNMLFGSLGFIGILLFLDVIWKCGFRKGMSHIQVYIIPLIFFLPNIHIWTCNFAKDGLIFFAIMLVTYSLSLERKSIPTLRKKIIFFTIGSFFIIMIRPHIYLLMLFSLVLTIILFGKQSWLIKGPILFALALAGYFIARTFVNLFFGMSSIDIALILEILENRQGYYVNKSYSGSSIDTSGYPFFFKLFSYMFRPLFEKLNFNYIAMGVDNVVALFFATALLSKRVFRFIKRAPFVVKFSLIYWLVVGGFLASMFSNFGIAVRQKTMVLYSFYVVLFAFVAYKSDLRKRQLERRRL